ncbi:MAG: hypothetical protein JWR69_4721 [Pedosphaera sp.]|nr:hypothetical protein [Pedosphaera sp.]
MKPSLRNLSPRSRSWTIARLSISFLIACLASGASAQTVISTVDGNNGMSFFNAYADMVSWTQTSTYSQVSIQVMLNGNGGTTAGTFYLMTQVGANTTTASELAHSSFSVSKLELVPLFTGLTLGPGTYYLVGSGSGPGGWELTVGNQPVVAAPGVSLDINNFKSQINNSYAPANDFSSWYYPPEARPPYNLEFMIQAVPEPAPATLLAAGLLSLLILAPIRAGSPQAKAIHATTSSSNS